MIQTQLRIENDLGLHARAAARLVQLTSRFQSRVKLSRTDQRQEIDGKSILGILLLGASKGTEIHLTVEGKDEQEAAAAILQLVQTGFGEGI